MGNDVYLDKDGSVMLNPVGYVDYGRISQDTGHSFGASRDAATGIAARYFMNRNFFVVRSRRLHCVDAAHHRSVLA